MDLLLPYLALGPLLARAQVLVIAEMAQGRHVLAKVAWFAVAAEIILCLAFCNDSAIQVLTAAMVAAGLVVVLLDVQHAFGQGLQRVGLVILDDHANGAVRAFVHRS